MRNTVIALLLIITLEGCIFSPPAPFPTPSPTVRATELLLPSAPEPPGVTIRGTISGLPEKAEATMVVMRPAAKGGTKFYHSNGAWEMSPILDEGKEYVVLASAEGFQARPGPYRIYALNGKAFRIEGGV